MDVPPGGFAIVWVDGDVNQGELHTDFKLSPNGGSILLFDRDANSNTPLDAFRFGKQSADVSVGRHPNGNGPWEDFENADPQRDKHTPTIVCQRNYAPKWWYHRR